MQEFKTSLRYMFHLRLVDTPGDGNCLFHAVAMALKTTTTNHTTIRRGVVQFMALHKIPLRVDDTYIAHMSTDGTWGGETELVALANVHRRAIEIYMFGPTGRATHARTYTPWDCVETAAPIRISLLPMSGRIEDAPNHFSFLEVAQNSADPDVAAEPVVIDLCDDDASVVDATPVAPKKAAKPSYYKLYERNMYERGMRPFCADLAARAEVAWYTCRCGKSCHKADTAPDAWTRVIQDDADVDAECQMWKLWSTYHHAVESGVIERLR